MTRGTLRRRLFQRGNGLVARHHLSLCRISPRIGGLPPHAFQACPADQGRDHTRQHRESAKGRADERRKPDHVFRSGRNAETRPSTTQATSA
jgi:hypothetical protein